MPLRPSRISCQVACAVWPSVVIAPMPVIATRRWLMLRPIQFAEGVCSALRCRGRRFRGNEFFDRLDQALDRFGVEVRIAVGQGDLVVILDLENDLYRVERLDLQLLERRVEGDLGGIDACLFGDDAE